MSDMENDPKNSERINRQNDENLYQPKIHSQRIRDLHTISESSGLPMTVLVDKAIEEFLERNSLNNGVLYEGEEVDNRELEFFLTKAYQRGHNDGARYIWLNVVDPLLGVNIALNRGERHEATDQLTALDSWIKQNLNVPDYHERNREGNI